MSTRRQRVLDALVEIQERRVPRPPLRVRAIVPRAAPADAAGFFSFVDERGRIIVAFAMSLEEAGDIAHELLPGAKQIHVRRLRSELGAPML